MVEAAGAAIEGLTDARQKCLLNILPTYSTSYCTFCRSKLEKFHAPNSSLIYSSPIPSHDRTPRPRRAAQRANELPPRKTVPPNLFHFSFLHSQYHPSFHLLNHPRLSQSRPCSTRSATTPLPSPKRFGSSTKSSPTSLLKRAMTLRALPLRRDGRRLKWMISRGR